MKPSIGSHLDVLKGEEQNQLIAKTGREGAWDTAPSPTSTQLHTQAQASCSLHFKHRWAALLSLKIQLPKPNTQL